MAKYIDAEKLKAEIERRIEETKSMKPSFDQFWAGQISAFKGAIKIAESLQQDQPTKGYDESYLNECIAKASKTWKGVDTDKYMDEVRGRGQGQQEECEEYGPYARQYPKSKVSHEQLEVDLEKEIDAVWNPRFNLGWDEHSALSMNHAGFASIARHFYELGLKARKEE